MSSLQAYVNDSGLANIRSSVGLFVGGFMIMIGLVIHGAVTGPVLVGSGLLRSLVEPVRIGLIAMSFFVSLLLGDIHCCMW